MRPHRGHAAAVAWQVGCGAHPVARLQPLADRRYGLRGIHLDHAFEDGNVHATGAAADIEGRADIHDLDAACLDGEGPVRLMHDGKEGLAFQKPDEPAPVVEGDVDGGLRCELDAAAVRQQ